METHQYINPRKRIKELTEPNIQDILYLLQPVSYTDNDHKADYYGNGIGYLIIIKQQAYIDVLSMNIIKCKTKAQIQTLFNSLEQNINYFPGWVINDKKRKGGIEFWESSFGTKVLSEFKWMLNKFVSEINEMVEV